METKCTCKGDKMCKKCKKDFGGGLVSKCRKVLNTTHGIIIGATLSLIAIVFSFGSISTLAWTEPDPSWVPVGTGAPTGNVAAPVQQKGGLTQDAQGYLYV